MPLAYHLLAVDEVAAFVALVLIVTLLEHLIRQPSADTFPSGEGN